MGYMYQNVTFWWHFKYISVYFLHYMTTSKIMHRSSIFSVLPKLQYMFHVREKKKEKSKIKDDKCITCLVWIPTPFLSWFDPRPQPVRSGFGLDTPSGTIAGLTIFWCRSQSGPTGTDKLLKRIVHAVLPWYTTRRGRSVPSHPNRLRGVLQHQATEEPRVALSPQLTPRYHICSVPLFVLPRPEQLLVVQSVLLRQNAIQLHCALRK